MNPLFFGKIQSGKVKLYDAKSFNKYLLSLQEKEIQISLGLVKKERSNRQNRWYWACVVGIPAEHYGYLPEEMHDCYKLMFLRMHDEGKPETVRSTTTLSTKEFIKYTEKCQQWAAEQGLIIPNPNQVEV